MNPTTIPTDFTWNDRKAATVHWPDTFRAHPNDGTCIDVVAIPAHGTANDVLVPDTAIFDPDGECWCIERSAVSETYTDAGDVRARWIDLKIMRAH